MLSLLPKCAFLLLVNISLFTIYVKGTTVDVLSRSRRQLLFPNSTLLQFNVGIGTPSPSKMVNMNWAVQANFQLPWNRSQIPFDLLEANSGYTGYSRRKRDVDTTMMKIERDGDYENDAKLYHFYKYVEEVLDSFGQNGTSCVLQTLCQLGAEPLHSDSEDDVLHELASFVLNPKHDAEHGLTEKDEHYKYIQAHKHGEDGQDCHKLYSNCSISLVDAFTMLHESNS